MGTITLPNNPGTIQNTQVTDATKVMENFTAIVAECNGSLDADNLAALAVETAKIANLAVTAAKLATDAVETLKIKDANVTTAKIANLNVTAGKLAADAVETAKIKDLNVTAGKLATDSVETAKIKDLNVTTGKIAADAVDDTKIGDAKIKKEHINADVVGTGLTGGAGTALSVDGIVEVGDSVELKCKVIEIGDWDMDGGTASINVPHGLANGKKIRMVTGLIRDDNDDYYYLLPAFDAGFTNIEADVRYVQGANIQVRRRTGGGFDAVSFDSTSYNRGWVTIWYEA